jgi:hypothetical protein
LWKALSAFGGACKQVESNELTGRGSSPTFDGKNEDPDFGAPGDPEIVSVFGLLTERKKSNQ